MPVVRLPVGGSVDVSVDATMSRAAAVPVLREMDKADAFHWRVRVGNPGGAEGAITPAMAAKFTLTPNGTPKGMTYGVRQIVFFDFSVNFYSGRAGYAGSILCASTAINSTWCADSVGVATGAGFAAPALPFFSSPSIAIANGTSTGISLDDTPGGTERLVRANLVTNTRNYLELTTCKNLFITYAVAVLPDASHFVLAGFSWRHDFRSTFTWDANAKPTMNANGDANFISKLNRDEIIAQAKTDLLDRNDVEVKDVIGFKFNNSLMNCEMKDAAMAPLRTDQPKKDIAITQANYSITHSKDQLL